MTRAKVYAIILRKKGGVVLKEKKKIPVQVIFGILLGLSVWGSSILLTGKIIIFEEIELYSSGALVLVFPLLFSAVCVLVSKHAVKSGEKAFFVSTTISLLVPMIAPAFLLLLEIIINSQKDFVRTVANWFYLAFVPVYIGPSSIITQLDAVFPDRAKFVAAIVACVIVMLSGLIASVVIFKKGGENS